LMGLATTMAGKLNGSAGVAALAAGAAVTRRPRAEDETEDVDDEHA
jgi:hypothetical protein